MSDEARLALAVGTARVLQGTLLRAADAVVAARAGRMQLLPQPGDGQADAAARALVPATSRMDFRLLRATLEVRSSALSPSATA